MGKTLTHGASVAASFRRLGLTGFAAIVGLTMAGHLTNPVKVQARQDRPILLAAGYAQTAGIAALKLKLKPTLKSSRKALAALRGRPLPASLQSDAEQTCLAKAIYFEARGETETGQKAVAEVILTRTQMKNRPRSICGVVYENSHRHLACQFTFTCDGNSDQPRDMAAWSRAKRIAAAVVAKGESRPLTRWATHYHTDYVSPGWSSKMVRTATIGSHIFFRDPRFRQRDS